MIYLCFNQFLMITYVLDASEGMVCFFLFTLLRHNTVVVSEYFCYINNIIKVELLETTENNGVHEL